MRIYLIEKKLFNLKFTERSKHLKIVYGSTSEISITPPGTWVVSVLSNSLFTYTDMVVVPMPVLMADKNTLAPCECLNETSQLPDTVSCRTDGVTMV